MIKHIYTYIRLILIAIPFTFLFFGAKVIALPFFVAVILFTLSIPAKRFINKERFTDFEVRLNYFMDEFFVYGAVILLSHNHIAPLWVVIVYFFKDATIGAIRNFAIKSGEELNERFGYKIDKVVQYCLIVVASAVLLCATNKCELINISLLNNLFIASAALSALTLLIFFIANKDFMKKIHHS